MTRIRTATRRAAIAVAGDYEEKPEWIATLRIIRSGSLHLIRIRAGTKPVAA